MLPRRIPRADVPNVIVLTGGGVIGYGARNAANCLGRYHLEADRDVNGRLVWRQNGEDAFLTFDATLLTWQAQTEAQLGSNECWLHAATCDTSGRAPCDAATWHWYDGHTWNDRSSITCVQAVAMQEKGGLPLVRVAGCRSRTVKFEMPTDMKEGSSLAVEISERQMLKLDINGDIKAGPRASRSLELLFASLPCADEREREREESRAGALGRTCSTQAPARQR